jgi:hypothetical protein
VYAESLAGCAEVARRPERVGAKEHAALRPPERDLSPAREADDPAKRERRSLNAGEGDDVERDPEMVGESGAVSVVPVEELNHPGGPARVGDAFLEAVGGKWIDEPNVVVRDQRVGGPLEETWFCPPEPMLELVAGPEIHLRRHRIETRI